MRQLMGSEFMCELTKKQIQRQDFVDDKIFELINELLPPSKKMDWDIEAIGEVRDAVRWVIVNKRKLMNEMAFYSYLDE